MVKAQDFDSCISLVRVQLSQPTKGTCLCRCLLLAGIVPISPKLLLRKSVGSHSPSEARQARLSGAGRANIRRRRKSNGTYFFMSDLDAGTKIALKRKKSGDFERFFHPICFADGVIFRLLSFSEVYRCISGILGL